MGPSGMDTQLYGHEHTSENVIFFYRQPIFYRVVREATDFYRAVSGSLISVFKGPLKDEEVPRAARGPLSRERAFKWNRGTSET